MIRPSLRPAVALALSLLVGCFSTALARQQSLGDGQPTAPPENADHAQLRELADRGEAEAQFNLGLAYAYGGIVIPPDFVKAVWWLGQAADQGFALAQYQLGNMYAYGEGVPQDSAQAASWFRQAADQGEAMAQSQLGRAYANGAGAPRNDVEAYKWLSLVGAIGPSRVDQARYAEAFNALAERMTPQQLDDARKLAREWRAAFNNPRK